MTSQEAQTIYIDLNKIDIPQDARAHDPGKLEELAADMAAEGQLQEIVVVPQEDRYEVVAGVGRVLAAQQLHWGKIRASVRQGLSEFDKARITFAENQDREDADPFYQASRLEKMQKAKGGTRKELAAILGVSDSLLSDYGGIQKLPEEIKANSRRLELNGLVQIVRLNDPNEQIRVNKLALDQDLSVRQLKALVDKALGKGMERRNGGSGKNPPPPTPRPADPLESLWPTLAAQTSASGIGFWGVTYAPHPLPNSKEVTMPAWQFWIANQGASPQNDLAQWFRLMAEALSSQGATSDSAGSQVNAYPKVQDVTKTPEYLAWKAAHPEEEKAMLEKMRAMVTHRTQRS